MFHKAHLTCAELRYPLLYLQDGLFSGGRHVCAPIIPTSALHPPVVLPPQRAGAIACTLVCCMLLRFRLSRGYTVMRATSLAYTGSTLCSCYLTVCTVFVFFLFFYNGRDRTHGDRGGGGIWRDGRKYIRQMDDPSHVNLLKASKNGVG